VISSKPCGYAEGGLQNYLKKGQQVFVSGELTQNEYKANDGTIKTSLELVANIIDLVGKPKDKQAGQTNTAPPVQDDPPLSDYDNFDDAQIPF
jgi:single-strand DNA-binding protein